MGKYVFGRYFDGDDQKKAILAPFIDCHDPGRTFSGQKWKILKLYTGSTCSVVPRNFKVGDKCPMSSKYCGTASYICKGQMMNTSGNKFKFLGTMSH